MTRIEEYKGNFEWIHDRTIYFTRYGSHAYGTSLPTSDRDFRGVAIPPVKYLLGCQETFDQACSKEPDLTIFGLQKFLKLAADCNPNVLELLYVDESDVLVCTPAGRRLRDARDLFLSKKARHTYSGYANQQLKRMMGHYEWHTNAPKAPPTRAEFGLPERPIISEDQHAAVRSAITTKLKDWNLDYLGELEPALRILIAEKMSESLAEMQISQDDLWLGAARSIGLDANMIEILQKDGAFEARMRDWKSFCRWKAERNAVRADLEAEFGYDTKHALHLVRLLLMCREILTTGQVIVRRPDAEFLLSIRRGVWSYHRLLTWATTQNDEIKILAKESKLPDSPNRKAIDDLCIELHEDELRRST